MLKCLDPEKRWIWTHPEDESIRFEYKALAGPTLGIGTTMEAIFQHYLDKCVTAAWGVSIGGVDYAEWCGTPPVRWSAVLPADIANVLTMKILEVSRLSEDERGESSAPHGSQVPDSGAAASPNAGRGAAPIRARTGKARGKK